MHNYNTDKAIADPEALLPIDPIFEKAKTWCGMTNTPVAVTLTVPNLSVRYYVITKTRMFTHRSFVALAAQYKWCIHPPESVIIALYEDALDNWLVAPRFVNEGQCRPWWGRLVKEFEFNCKEWADEHTDPEILAFMDLENIKFKFTNDKMRSDDHRNYAGIQPFKNPCGEIMATVEDYPHEFESK